MKETQSNNSGLHNSSNLDNPMPNTKKRLNSNSPTRESTPTKKSKQPSESTNPIQSSSSGYKQVYSRATKNVTRQLVSQVPTQVRDTENNLSDCDSFLVINDQNEQETTVTEKTQLTSGTSSVEQEIQHQLIPGAQRSLSGNTISAHNNLVNTSQAGNTNAGYRNAQPRIPAAYHGNTPSPTLIYLNGIPGLFTPATMSFPPNSQILFSPPIPPLLRQTQNEPSQPIQSSSSGSRRAYSWLTKEIRSRPANSFSRKNSQVATQIRHTKNNHSDINSSVVVNTPNEQEITGVEKTRLTLKSILKEIATTNLLKKLCHKTKKYIPSNYSIDSTNKEKLISEITSIINIDSAELIANHKLSVSKDTVNKYFKHFKEMMELILLPKESTDTQTMISKLFVRVFSIALVNVIREHNIPLIDMDDYSGEAYSDSIKTVWNYSRFVKTENNSFILNFTPNSGKTIAHHFIIDEIANTTKGTNKSNQATWDDDNQLHMSIFPALEKFISSPTVSFESKHIKQQINRRSQLTHFRPTAVIDIYNYLVQENVINAGTAINFFDSSIGWLDRLTAALLGANGKAFKSYVGFDPNPKVITAGNQLIADLKPDYNPNFNAQLYQQGIETANANDIVKNNGGHFSFAFTSPPFFAAQKKYAFNRANENAQTWKLYKTKEQYKSHFLKPLLQTNFNILTAGGVFGLHFKEQKLLIDTLELVNKDINNDSMKMTVWRQGIYYPKSQKASYEIIYLFKRPNCIEEIPSPLISSTSAEKLEIQHQLISRASSSAESSLLENAVSARNNTTFVDIDSSTDSEHSASQQSGIEDCNESFTSPLIVNQGTVLIAQQNSLVSVSSSRNTFFSQSSVAQSNNNIVSQPGHAQARR